MNTSYNNAVMTLESIEWYMFKGDSLSLSYHLWNLYSALKATDSPTKAGLAPPPQRGEIQRAKGTPLVPPEAVPPSSVLAPSSKARSP